MNGETKHLTSSDDHRFDFLLMGETQEQAHERLYGKAKLTRGSSIEKLPDRSDREGWTKLLGNRDAYARGETFEDVILAKLNEVIDRINQMGEVRGP